MDVHQSDGSPLTIYDVARHAGVSIASVSRVLNGRDNPRPETRERVLRAVAELGFVPDGAARALSSRLKEVVGIVFLCDPVDRPHFHDEEEALLFADMINRGVELAAQRRNFDLLLRSVDAGQDGVDARITSLAAKTDGLILHDRVLTPDAITRLARHTPVVTLAGTATPTAVNVRVDNTAGMTALARHLFDHHAYRTVGYIAGKPDSPDNVARHTALAAAARDCGARLVTGPAWHGHYTASGSAAVIRRLLERGMRLPRVIVCANDQAAMGVMYALAEAGLDIPGDVAVTGFDDLPMARLLRPQLTTVRQPIQELGAVAFDLLHAMIGGEAPAEREVVLPTRLVVRGSCGCTPPPQQPGQRAAPSLTATPTDRDTQPPDAPRRTPRRPGDAPRSPTHRTPPGRYR